MAGGRVIANAAVFFIDWDDLQLNLPNPFVPAQFYIANVGGARSRGVEFEVSARPQAGLDVFGSLGYTSATFKDGTVSSGLDVTEQSAAEHAAVHVQRRRADLAPGHRAGERLWARRDRVLRRVLL